MTKLTKDIKEIQRNINSGLAWRLEGSYGRMAMDYINHGLCMLGVQDHRDYWGNHVPNRNQVKEGAKGSYSFVASQHGEEYAKKVSKVTEVKRVAA